ncbi:hypothetical protein [Leptotrichia sp. oral taxon 879]|uniref:hypothetical protein n=1 Tax=Leptotrichia sp. oral taxon 879 TaxID=1227267 RepID=UPI0003ADB504|nr:hypothetical protein [Leptotrichia sp. oral taxon 879]ERK51791.1 hypothetical protein HMPREF1552_00988 [Leptotrichia sp. oral taxon 879 str. F0557]
MKKLITIILFIFSMQIFAGQYQVIKQKNVTLSKEQIDLENKKIEETVSKYPKKVLQEMISYYFSVSNKVNNEMSKEEKESIQLLLKEFSSFFSEIFNNSKFNIKTVKYLSNRKVSVTYEVVILDSDKILDEKEIKKRFFKKYGYEIKDAEDFFSLSEVKKWIDIMNEMLREGMRNPKNYVTDKVTNELNKIGNDWKFKDAEKFEEMLKKMK